VFLCKEARDALQAYLEDDKNEQDHGPLFITSSGARMNRQDVDHLLKSLARQANVRRTGRPIQFSAHTLRHTFLRKVAQERGVEFAMQMSGHASSKYIWRYVKPSDEQTEAALEDLF
jgi:integrase/recombinase XerD